VAVNLKDGSGYAPGELTVEELDVGRTPINMEALGPRYPSDVAKYGRRDLLVRERPRRSTRSDAKDI